VLGQNNSFALCSSAARGVAIAVVLVSRVPQRKCDRVWYCERAPQSDKACRAAAGTEQPAASKGDPLDKQSATTT